MAASNIIISDVKVINTGGPKYKRINGHNFIANVPEQVSLSALEYQALSDDLFIVTYPKNGTTWTQQIVTLLLNNGHLPDDVTTKGLYARSVFLDFQGKGDAEKTARPCSIKTHLPRSLQPWHDEAKYMVIVRNVKDVVVSFYHHSQLFDCYDFRGRSFNDFFEYFLQGDIESGCYFDWYLSWWAFRSSSNVEFFVYEDMKTQPKEQIRKMAKFISSELEQKVSANNDEILNRVVKNSSIEHMKETTNKTLANTFKIADERKEQFTFVRKGIVGDFRTHLSVDQNTRLEQKYYEKFKGTGLDDLWNDYNIFES